MEEMFKELPSSLQLIDFGKSIDLRLLPKDILFTKVLKTIPTPSTVRPKTKSCFEDLRTKSIIMVKKRPFEKNEDLMRTHFRAFEDPKSLFSLKCEMVIKKRVFTTLHIL